MASYYPIFDDDKDVAIKQYVEKKYQTLIQVYEFFKNDINDSILKFTDENSKKLKRLEKKAITMKDDVYDVNDKLLSNVKDPVSNNDVVTKNYLDHYIFHATTEHYGTYESTKIVHFDRFTSDLLKYDAKDELRFTIDAEIEITLFLKPWNRGRVSYHITIGGMMLRFVSEPVDKIIKTTCTVNKNDKFLLQLTAFGRETGTRGEYDIKPYLTIEVLNFIYI